MRDNLDTVKKGEEKNKSCSGIKCMCTNVRSIMNKGKREELQCLLIEKLIAVLGVTESWTHQDISDAELHMLGYNVFRRDRDFDRVGKNVVEVCCYIFEITWWYRKLNMMTIIVRQYL